MNLARLSLGVCPTPDRVGSDGAVTPKVGGCVVGYSVPKSLHGSHQSLFITALNSLHVF